MNIPFLKKVNFKTFTYAELAFYPTFKKKSLNFSSLFEDTRLSAGFGIGIPINHMISILIYYNALNFNSAKVGDYERKGYINVNIGFF